MMSGYPRWLRPSPGIEARDHASYTALLASLNGSGAAPQPEPSTGAQGRAKGSPKARSASLPVGGSCDSTQAVTDGALRLLKARLERH